MSTTTRTSLSLQNELWEQLQHCSNKSQVMNEALKLYFDRQTYLEKAEAQYWKNVDHHIKNNTGEYIVINANSGEITDKDINEILWK